MTKITKQELTRLLAGIDGDNVVPIVCDNGELSHYEVINLAIWRIRA